MEQLAKLPKWGQWLVVLIIGLVIVGVVYYFLVKPKNEEIVRLNRDIEALASKIRQGKEAQRRIDELNRQISMILKDLEVFKSIIPLDPQTGRLLRAFQSFARDQNLGISEISPQKVKEQEHYSEQPYKMLVSGGYHDIALFFDKIAHMRRIVNINHLKMENKKSKRGGYSIEAQFNSVVYMQKPEPAEMTE